MSEITAPAAAPAQEQPAAGASASASFFISHKQDVTQYKPGVPQAPAELVADPQPQASEPGASTEAAAEQPEKPYSAQETIQAVQQHIPGVDPYSLRLAEGLISRSLTAAQSTPLTPGAIAEGHTQCMNFLQDKHGAAKADNLVALAQKELAQLAVKMPGLPQILETSGRGNDPWLVEQLAHMHVKRQFANSK